MEKRRIEILQIKLTPEEKQKVKELAKNTNLNLSEYVRQLIFKK